MIPLSFASPALQIPPLLQEKAHEFVRTWFPKLWEKSLKEPQKTHTVAIQFPVDTTDWKYNDLIEKRPNASPFNTSLIIRLIVKPNPQNSRFHSGGDIDQIILEDSPVFSKEQLQSRYTNSLIATLDHELTHFAQFHLANCLNLPHPITPKQKDPRFDPRGVSVNYEQQFDQLSPNERKNLANTTNLIEKQQNQGFQSHEERPIELDANIQGWLTRFKQKLSFLPKELHRPYLDLILGLNQKEELDTIQYDKDTEQHFDEGREVFPFTDLKQRNPTLWKAYAKKFVGALKDSL